MSSKQLSFLCPKLLLGFSAWQERKEVFSEVRKASIRHKIAPELVLAVIAAESRCDIDARSRAGAQGLMQLMPQTAKWLGVQDPYSVAENIDGGSRYLAYLVKRFHGDLELALAAYNAGPTRVARLKRVPPFLETIQYVERTLSYYRLLKGEENKTLGTNEV